MPAKTTTGIAPKARLDVHRELLILRYNTQPSDVSKLTKMTEKLFAYGTLKDPVIQTALFGRQLNGYAAHIENWGLFMAQEGYLFVKPVAGSRVDGLILELESEDLDKADAWEDLTVYSREVSCAITNNKTESVYIYTRRSAVGSSHQGDSLHGRTLSEILHDIYVFIGHSGYHGSR